ncbi:MAG: hypothetical protein OXF42_07520 [Candidatus Dadabacteria bacterium]|nr:hypothetical protein [Candidatus Dadabacteria bacterium]
MKTVFIGGSRKLPRLNSTVRARLNSVIASNCKVVVGEAGGADKAVQGFFAQEGYKNVVIYCMDGEYRNNLGNWETVVIDSGGRRKDFKYFAMKDAEMSRVADFGIMIWDGKSRGTLNNIFNLLEQRKEADVYFSPDRRFVSVKSLEDVEGLIGKCGYELKSRFGETIRFSEKTGVRQGELNLL